MAIIACLGHHGHCNPMQLYYNSYYCYYYYDDDGLFLRHDRQWQCNRNSVTIPNTIFHTLVNLKGDKKEEGSKKKKIEQKKCNNGPIVKKEGKRESVI